jgi:tRNA(fMet)-specific endonuclease VapC
LTLLDTNVLIHYLKGDALIVERIQASSKSDLAVPCIAVFELEYGTLKAGGTRRRNRLESVLKDLHQVPFDSAAALASARIRIHLEERGITIGPLDLLIAGTALSRAALLVTNNAREFSRVPGLRVADWRSA